METPTSCEKTNIKKLDLNAPFLSARRLRCCTKMNQSSSTISSDARRRVPFLWERSPGVPKDPPAQYSSDEEEFFTPKLPPGRWRPSKEDAKVHYCDDEGDEDDANQVFLDALEKISLPESISGVGRSPSFIMERFLPAAHALAMSSTYSTPKLQKRRVSSSRSREKLEVVRYVPRVENRPQSPAKACGLMVFFPWSLKHNVCGFKNRSPVSTSDQDKMSTRECRTSGWGVHFLNSSRLRSSRDSCVRDEVNMIRSGIVCAKKPNEGDGALEREKTVLGLPQLRVPAESWLHQTVNNKR